MDKLTKLLSEINKIVQYNTQQEKESIERGENFNLFSILNIERTELKHSSMIAELLNPRGSHYMKDSFLKAFIEIIDSKLNFNFDNTEVYKEYYIGEINKNYTKGGKIDILIEDYDNLIIIENKIDAYDEKKQMLRYYNYAKANGRNYELYYLTIGGHTASDYSTGGKEIIYNCISYRNTITKWLEKCSELSKNKPFVYNSLTQYINNVKNISGIMNKTNIDKLVKTCIDPKNVDSTLAIYRNIDNISQKIREKFIDCIEELAKKYDLELEYDDGLFELIDNTWIYLFNNRLSEHWAICIGNDKNNKSNGFYYCISQHEFDNPHVSKKILKEIKPFWSSEGQSNNNPYGYEYFPNNWWDWSDVNTLQDMTNGKLLEFIEKNVINPIIENDLLQKIEKITSK